MVHTTVDGSSSETNEGLQDFMSSCLDVDKYQLLSDMNN